MTVPPNLLTILACPSCKGKLVWNQNKTELVCRGEQLAYPVTQGVPQLLLANSRDVTRAELEKLDKP